MTNIIQMPPNELVLVAEVEKAIKDLHAIGYCTTQWCKGFDDEGEHTHESVLYLQLPIVAVQCFARGIDLLDRWFFSENVEYSHNWLPKSGLFRSVEFELVELFTKQTEVYPVVADLALDIDGMCGEDQILSSHLLILSVSTQLDAEDELPNGVSVNVFRLQKLLSYLTLLTGVLAIDPLRRMFGQDVEELVDSSKEEKPLLN